MKFGAVGHGVINNPGFYVHYDFCNWDFQENYAALVEDQSLYIIFTYLYLLLYWL